MSTTLSPVGYNYLPSTPAVLVMKPALEFADDTNFEEIRKERKSQKTFSVRLFLALVRPMNKALGEVQESIMQMTPDEAQLVLNELCDYQTIIGDMRQETATGSISPEASEIEREMFYLMTKLVTIFDDLKIISEGTPIDEESEDYKNFIQRLVAESEDTPIKYGKKALFDLFKD